MRLYLEDVVLFNLLVSTGNRPCGIGVNGPLDGDGSAMAESTADDALVWNSLHRDTVRI